MDNLSEKGAILKKARQDKGITLEIVHEHTKIPLDALRALEEGYTIRTLSPFYQKGFLKIYAQYLECDLKEILADFKPKETISSSSSILSSSKVLPKKPIKLQPEFSINERFQEIFTRKRVMVAGKILGSILVIFFAFKAIGFVVNKISTRTPRKAVVKEKTQSKSKSKKEKPSKDIAWESSPAAATQELPETLAEPVAQPDHSTQPVPPETAPAVVVASPTEAAAESVKNVSLSVRPKKNSWLQVKSDGTIVFEAILKKGVSETWTADHDIELVGKNISELEFEVNGKMVGVLSRDERRAKKVFVTKNGLSVKK